jgi:hypothetical protein
MTPDDPLFNLLHTADAAATPPLSPADLPQQVRRRYTQRQRTAQQWKLGVAGTATLVVIMAASINFHQPPVPPGNATQMGAGDSPRRDEGAGNSPLPSGEGQGEGAGLVAASAPTPAELAELKKQADALGAQADTLEKQLNLARDEQHRQDLRDEYRRQLAANAHAETEESPIDRAAAVALGEGDYYWQIQQARGPAEAAYQSVLDNFPQSHWAEVAKARLSQFQMN